MVLTPQELIRPKSHMATIYESYHLLAQALKDNANQGYKAQSMERISVMIKQLHEMYMEMSQDMQKDIEAKIKNLNDSLQNQRALARNFNPLHEFNIVIKKDS